MFIFDDFSEIVRVIPKSSCQAMSSRPANCNYSGRELLQAGNGFPKGSAVGAIGGLNFTTSNESLLGKIRDKLNGRKVEISPSAYDTAWVAMVPEREYSGGKRACFPECLDWVMENQNPDGSWGLDPGHPHLVKDSLSGTLACVLALRKWNAGNQLIQRGLNFIGSNGWAAADKDLFSPMGFGVVFPAMVQHAEELTLSLPFNPALVDSLRHIRDSEIRKNKNMEYFAEGLGDLCNWGEILKNQRNNGSLFNSPATTAAALMYSHDDKCVQYLKSVLKSFNGWAPTVYPLDICTRLCMVDALERLGIDGYFSYEIGSILENIYRSWQEKDEEIFSDLTCLAMAFRLLRMKGYDVSSDELAEFVNQERSCNMACIQNDSATSVLELYRASQLRTNEEEVILENIHDWTSKFLKEQLLNGNILDKRLHKRMEYDLKNFHGTLDRVGHRQNNELYDAQGFQMLKTAYRCPSIHCEDFILFAAQDYNISQVQYQKELKEMNRWYAECRLDQLNQRRNVLQITYLFTSAVITHPHLSMARMSFTKVVVLVTCLDDFFEHYGSKQEALYLCQLVKDWNRKPTTTYCSKDVEILFTALYHMVKEVAGNAFAEQGYSVEDELVGMWLELVTIFSTENEMNVTSLDEYLSYASKTIASHICIFTSIPFFGNKLPEEIFTCAESASLCKHTSYICRLLNDLKTFKKESGEGMLNGVTIQTIKGGVSEEEAILNVQKIIEYSRRKVLRMVYQRKGSIFPRECRELFWKTCKIAHCMYPHDGGDEFTSPQTIAKDLNAVAWEPLDLEIMM